MTRFASLGALLLATTAVVGGCIGGPGNLGVAWLRNESKSVVTIAIDNPGTSILGGRDHLVFLVPPWQTGWCPAFGYGINKGSVTITVSGDTVPFPTTTTFDVTQPQTMVLTSVEADGTVQFSRGSPTEGKPCRAYPAGRPTDAIQPGAGGG